MTDNDILTIPEIARLLKIADKTVYALAQQRAIPAFKVGGQWRFSRAALDSWIEAKTASFSSRAGKGRRRRRAR